MKFFWFILGISRLFCPKFEPKHRQITTLLSPGVAGSIFIVVPNLMGICVWSPPLDSLGNSYRGIEFAKMLCKRFSFHQVLNTVNFGGFSCFFSYLHGIRNTYNSHPFQYDAISGGLGAKIDPRRYQTSETKESQIVNMLFAASASDTVLLQKYLQVHATIPCLA